MNSEQNKIFLIGNDNNQASLVRETLQKQAEQKPEPRTLLNVSQLKEGQRVSIGKILFKVQRVRPDKTIVLKPIGNID